MPIYEYLCLDCGKKSSFLTLSVKAAFEPRCPDCGSLNLRKLVSRVAVLRSEGSGDEFGDDSSEWGGEGPESMDDEGPIGGGEDEGGGGDDDLG